MITNRYGFPGRCHDLEKRAFGGEIGYAWLILLGDLSSHKHLYFIWWLKSDLHPLLLRMQKSLHQNRHRQPFRFEVTWVMHTNFPDFIRIQREGGTHYSSWSLQCIISLQTWKYGIKRFLVAYIEERGSYCADWSGLIRDKTTTLMFMWMRNICKCGQFMNKFWQRRKSCGPKSLKPNGWSLEIEAPSIFMVLQQLEEKISMIRLKMRLEIGWLIQSLLKTWLQCFTRIFIKFMVCIVLLSYQMLFLSLMMLLNRC